MVEMDQNPSGMSRGRIWSDFRRGLIIFALLCAGVWICLFWIYKSLPYLQSGSEIITAAKISYSLAHPIFDQDAKVRILVFGDSRTLAAFNPRVFDEQLTRNGIAGKPQSFNEGLPGEQRFLVYLERILQAGTRPTHVLIQLSPGENDRETTLSEWLRHDKMIVDSLFPFRTLPRDLTLFLFSAVSERSGLLGLYDQNARIAEQVVRDRGYFFIKGQSHFPQNKLPENYKLETDTPARVAGRPISKIVPSFRVLLGLAKQYGFKIILFPAVYRVGEFAPPPIRDLLVSNDLASRELLIVGEDYWLMSPGNFSDPIHVNSTGAGIYSTRLAGLMAAVLRRDDR
jgi:hypothetical protein